MISAGSQNRRVVITGLGVVSPLGNTVAQMWQAMLDGQSGVAPLQMLPPLEGVVHFGGEAREFTGAIDNFGELTKDRKKAIRKALKVMCRETMMAVSAAQEAVNDAGYGEEPMDPERSGVVFGSDYMLSPPEDFTDGMVKCGVADEGFKYDDWGGDGLGEMNPLWMLKYLPNMPGSHIAIFNDLRGPNNSLTLREVSGVMAIREAAQTIARGHADRMLAGSTGTRIHSFKTVHAWQTEQLADAKLPPAEACRPVRPACVGEGAGAIAPAWSSAKARGPIMLEELESAQSRGATIYGEILGTGSSTVTTGDLQGDPKQALANAARAAMADGQLSPEQLGHVNAHAMGTTEGDAAEAAITYV